MRRALLFRLAISLAGLAWSGAMVSFAGSKSLVHTTPAQIGHVVLRCQPRKALSRRTCNLAGIRPKTLDFVQYRR